MMRTLPLPQWVNPEGSVGDRLVVLEQANLAGIGHATRPKRAIPSRMCTSWRMAPGWFSEATLAW